MNQKPDHSKSTMYSPTFYQERRCGSRQSAEAVVPLVLGRVGVNSVVDVGCGTGTWLSVFRRHGVEDIVGIDGDHVDRRELEVPPDCFVPFDLTQRLHLDRSFELVVSLEVAEHLPTQCAETFVKSLISLGPIVLFSAAIPFQGGVHHVNEQWPAYWAGLFDQEGYIAVDCLRRTLWMDDHIDWWYAQNILLYVRKKDLDYYPSLKTDIEQTGGVPQSIVHPKKYLEVVGQGQACSHQLWACRVELARRDMKTVIPRDAPYILVDEQAFSGQVVDGCGRAIPFMERDGRYWGRPGDDRVAIDGLEHLIKTGAKFMVFAWPCFWWLNHYTGMAAYLRSHFRCVMENDRVIVFDLKQEDTA